ncbi:hypothetical protein TPHA_0K01540 [Tetrapisispora phaffii CBS 4417]|uniref:Uncharacterized protein n=1 Tax=Tetrapisispora phaffii (strain ATCC 24235 / CBS 4417 / NBRC 1672 / NRRL Y-8282 / UCD 70-5) TaxID=1071381 RepID=G8BZF9_TETPH|nr:hypothetical protein TPHA_0K01540 [Tetrapisispora phaffii CBS 4417]CCE65287.1 hypothetical protein TPHA_0K01540 [Tetrapisispora phaffii CBS 4417]
MTKSVYPDELISIVSQEIAYNKGSISFDKLWTIVGNYIELTDKNIKAYIFQNLQASPDIDFYRNGVLMSVEPELLENNLDDFQIKIKEDKLWELLTGYNKKECKIGAAAFELLLEIASSKEAGINTKNLADVAKQDRRSVTGRIKKIEHLIKSTQLVYQGHIVKLIKLNKFANDDEKIEEYVSIREKVGTIVKIVKNSKNRIRQIIDLRRELKYDQNSKMSKSFLSAITWLQEKGCLRKVYVVSPSDPSRKIRCVQYVKDFDTEDKISESYESDSDDEEATQTEKMSDDNYDDLDNLNSTHLLQGDGLILTESEDDVQRSTYSINRFYPIQNQTYEFAKNSGTDGVSMMDAVKSIVGRDYKRAFTRSSDSFIETVGKQTSHTDNDSIVRVYDFEGKKKFYRLFSKANFEKLAGIDGQKVEAGFPVVFNSTEKFKDINLRESKPIVDSLRFATVDGVDKFFWHGTLDIPKSSGVISTKRGRKRKGATESESETRKLQQKSKIYTPSIETSDDKLPLVIDTLSNAEVNNKLASNIFNVGGFTAGSLRSLKRQQAILSVVTKMGGISSTGDRFLDAVSRHLGSLTIVDKKTLRGDIELMVSGEKLKIQYDFIGKRQYIYLPTVTEEQFSDHLLKEKDNKKTFYSKDTLHDTDIYFFDQTEKNRFHRGVKSAERVKKFQEKGKTKRATSSSSFPKAESRNISKKRMLSASNGTNSSSGKKSELAKQKLVQTLKTQFHLGSKLGLKSLIFCVVISKSIKNEILWDVITKLFPSNSLQNLKKQWTTYRVRMGYHGWKAYVHKWKRILLTAIKDETILFKDVEALDLPKLVKLWMDYENKESNKCITLYKNFGQNRKKYSFVNNKNNLESYISLAMSSMVQREVFLLKKCYTTNISIGTREHSKIQDFAENEIKAIIRSILMDVSETSKDKMSILDNFQKEDIDKVVMEMAREKQLYLHGSKLEASSTVDDILNAKSHLNFFSESAHYKNRLEEMLEMKNGIVISKEINDCSSAVLIDLISREKLKLDLIPLERKFEKLNYSTRTLDRTYLTPPLIVSRNNSNLNVGKKRKMIPVPPAKAFSRLWINAEGNVRENIWKKAVSMVLYEILFNPGIVVSKLVTNCSDILCDKELVDICDWLKEKELIYDAPFSGFSASYNWYTFLS